MGKKGTQALEKNPNWNGGRTIASNGYVLVKDPTNPNADVRGYVYEHRLVAERKIGRYLKEGEVVHHKDGNKQNNDPDNLEVCIGSAEHHFYHRIRKFGRRLPGEDNPVIECSCGCGEKLNKYDEYGRPRHYITGHNPPQDSHVMTAILDMLKDGPKSRVELSVCSISVHAVAVALSRMKHQGLVTNIKHGIWKGVHNG